MIQIDQLKLHIPHDSQALIAAIVKKLRIKEEEIKSFQILKKSIDARKKPDLFFVYSVVIETTLNEDKLLNRIKKDNNIHKYTKKPFEYLHNNISIPTLRPVIIGAGPAGLFAAYILAINGFNPIIFERGKKVDDRTVDVIKFWETGVLDTKSNVQFGEGGAGTFSDGKLNTLVNDKAGRNKFVLETFVKFGAPQRILYDGKPHIGTDILKTVISNMREAIISLGGEFHFSTQVTDLEIENSQIRGLYSNAEFTKASDVVLAIGHSARDTFEMLYSHGFNMEAKDFAVGFRIEHPQDMISKVMYGDNYKLLEAAPYKLTANLENGRGVYSFCMCPGGYVVNSSSEDNRLVVNGMSYSKRDSKNANSAIVVSVGAREFDKASPLSGIAYQRSIEEKAYMLGNGLIPQQLYLDFKNSNKTSSYGDFASETKGSTCFANINEIFSQDINKSIVDAMTMFGTKINGYDRPDAILSGVESRTSSPVRINRDFNFISNIDGVYPCGEGAGYAGGITSAAMDGIKVAEAIINKYKN